MKMINLIIHPSPTCDRKELALLVSIYDGVLSDVVKLGMKSYRATFVNNSMAQQCKEELERAPYLSAKIVWEEGS